MPNIFYKQHFYIFYKFLSCTYTKIEIRLIEEHKIFVLFLSLCLSICLFISLCLSMCVGKPWRPQSSPPPPRAPIKCTIHLLAVCFWISHNFDLERCGDCVSEACLLRRSTVKPIFQTEALMPDFDMLLFKCCKEKKTLCHAVHL